MELVNKGKKETEVARDEKIIITVIIALLSLLILSHMKVMVYIPEKEIVITKNILGKIIEVEENISYNEYTFRAY